MADTPRRPFAAAASAALASTAPPVLGPGGCPFQITTPRWLQKKEEEVPLHIEHHPSVIFVLGGPGAGKGTHCGRIESEFRYEHFSIGDLLRKERSRPDSDIGELINQHIMQGSLVPPDVTVEVLKRAMNAVEDWRHVKFLIDGFPRTVEQMEAFKKIMGSRVTVKACLFLDVSERTSTQRLCKMRDEAGNFARDDDTDDIIKMRIANFRKEVASIQRFFQYEGLLERIDANRDLEKVWHDVQLFFVGQTYHDGEATTGSPVKAIWKLRDKQSEEMFPTGHSHTSTTSTKGAHARQFSSYTILSRHRDKHTRNMKSPMDNFIEPMTMAQEIGWHQPEDGENIGAKGTPRGMNTPRAFYPRNTCAMTRHLENMYSTNAQHIIRRW